MHHLHPTGAKARLRNHRPVPPAIALRSSVASPENLRFSSSPTSSPFHTLRTCCKRRARRRCHASCTESSVFSCLALSSNVSAWIKDASSLKSASKPTKAHRVESANPQKHVLLLVWHGLPRRAAYRPNHPHRLCFLALPWLWFSRTFLCFTCSFLPALLPCAFVSPVSLYRVAIVPRPPRSQAITLPNTTKNLLTFVNKAEDRAFAPVLDFYSVCK